MTTVSQFRAEHMDVLQLLGASIAREFLAVIDLHDRPMVQGDKLQDGGVCSTM